MTRDEILDRPTIFEVRPSGDIRQACKEAASRASLLPVGAVFKFEANGVIVVVDRTTTEVQARTQYEQKRQERDALAAEIAALRTTLIGWVELGEEMRRILENDVLIADWFAPRLYAALARGSAPSSDPVTPKCPWCETETPVFYSTHGVRCHEVNTPEGGIDVVNCLNTLTESK